MWFLQYVFTFIRTAWKISMTTFISIWKIQKSVEVLFIPRLELFISDHILEFYLVTQELLRQMIYFQSQIGAFLVRYRYYTSVNSDAPFWTRVFAVNLLCLIQLYRSYKSVSQLPYGSSPLVFKDSLKKKVTVCKGKRVDQCKAIKLLVIGTYIIWYKHKFNLKNELKQ